MSQFNTIFLNFMLIGLIAFSVLAFTTTFQAENNVNSTQRFINNPTINATYGDLNTQLSNVRDQSQAQKTLFETEDPKIGTGALLLTSIISSGKVFNGIIIGVYNTLIVLPSVILGLDPIVTGVLSSLLILMIIVSLWILYKSGG